MDDLLMRLSEHNMKDAFLVAGRTACETQKTQLTFREMKAVFTAQRRCRDSRVPNISAHCYPLKMTKDGRSRLVNGPHTLPSVGG